MSDIRQTMTKIKGPYFMKRGEYDLVNIMILGHDPSTGKSFDECNSEWREQLSAVEEEAKVIKWYNFVRQVKWRLKVVYLTMKQGVPF